MHRSERTLSIRIAIESTPGRSFSLRSVGRSVHTSHSTSSCNEGTCSLCSRLAARRHLFCHSTRHQSAILHLKCPHRLAASHLAMHITSHAAIVPLPTIHGGSSTAVITDNGSSRLSAAFLPVRSTGGRRSVSLCLFRQTRGASRNANRAVSRADVTSLPSSKYTVQIR